MAFPPTEINKGLLAYSPLFIDLYDGGNQADYYRAYCIKYNFSNTSYKKYPNDKVSFYATTQVVSALRTATNLTQLRENIKIARYNSEADKIKIDTLFSRYIYYWNKYK